jgi:hypothetical protein
MRRRLGMTGLGAFKECPRCAYPMIPVNRYSSSSDTSGFPGLGLPDSFEEAVLRELHHMPTDKELEWYMGWWHWLDAILRRRKLRGLLPKMRKNPHAHICPNCLHLDGLEKNGFGRFPGKRR